jgi:uncharacterized protein DUF6484
MNKLGHEVVLDNTLVKDSARQMPSDDLFKSLNSVPTMDSSKQRCNQTIAGVAIGRFMGIDESSELLVDFSGNQSGRYLSAQSIVPLNTEDAGRNIVLMFEGGDPLKPVILGAIQPKPANASTASDNRRPHSQPANNAFEVKTEGDRILLNAKSEIVFNCGKASIVLTKAGKILLRGAYLLARSSGVNRIKGASVQIN